MPLISNTSGAIDRTRLADWATKEEKVTVVAATDAATVQVAATLAGAARTLYTMTPTLVGVAATFSVAAASSATYVAVFTAADTVSIYRA
jgi:CTP:molybdopterin cytidylyltransferase MocA